MQQLIDASKTIVNEHDNLPFALYSSVKEQSISNVPIIKPLLICVLDGYKQLHKNDVVKCPAGNFVFLSNSPDVVMRNVPNDSEYLALAIEFDYSDFDCFSFRQGKMQNFFQGRLDSVLQQTIQQFIEWSVFAPKDMWPLRRQEVLHMMHHQGFTQVASMLQPPSLAHQLHNIISEHIGDDLTADSLASRFAMSNSTLRRKLRDEGESLQAIKDRARLARGLHLVQSTFEPISYIAEQCGYQSQSRFTDKFKQLFGITPSELRKTRLPE